MTTVEIARLEFHSIEFDTTGPPPEEAINGQYGRDLAQWLCGRLSDEKFHFDAEDWGWYVETTVTYDEALGTQVQEVRIYDHGFSETLEDPAWTLEVATREKRPRLKFFTRWQAVDVDQGFAARVLEHLRSVAGGDILAELVQKDRAGNDRGSRPFVQHRKA